VNDFRLRGELHGHDLRAPILLAAMRSELDDWEERRRRGVPLPTGVISPARDRPAFGLVPWPRLPLFLHSGVKAVLVGTKAATGSGRPPR
jgi:hypothetical protein